MEYKNVSEFWKSKGGRKINATILGGIPHDSFWKEKHYAPRGMRCNVENLKNVCQGKKIIMATEEEMKDKKMKRKFLQQNNYVLDGKKELVSIEKII